MKKNFDGKDFEDERLNADPIGSVDYNLVN